MFFIAWYSRFWATDRLLLTTVFALALWAIFAAIPLVARRFDDVAMGVFQPVGAAVFGALTMYSVLVDSGDRAAEPWVAPGLCGGVSRGIAAAASVAVERDAPFACDQLCHRGHSAEGCPGMA